MTYKRPFSRHPFDSSIPSTHTVVLDVNVCPTGPFRDDSFTVNSLLNFPAPSTLDPFL